MFPLRDCKIVEVGYYDPLEFLNVSHVPIIRMYFPNFVTKNISNLERNLIRRMIDFLRKILPNFLLQHKRRKEN